MPRWASDRRPTDGREGVGRGWRADGDEEMNEGEEPHREVKHSEAKRWLAVK
jgi:hypothetical protein